MQTIFAIDGAEFGDLGAFSQSLSRLQSWLVTLGQKTGEGTLQILVVDGLIGPKTQAATNLAFSKYFSGAGVGTLTQAQVAARADELANLVQAGIAKAYPSTAGVIATVAAKEAPKTTALVPYTAPAATPKIVAPTYIPAPVDTSSGLQADIIKWSAIGLGLVIATAGIYYVIRRRGMRPALAGCDLGDFGMKGDRINDEERRLWVSNDEGLYNWYQSEARRGDGGGMKAFIKRNRAEIDAAIRRVRDRPPAQTRFYGLGGAGFYHTDTSEFRVGQRVQIHPGMDLWMRGARYGTVKKLGRERVHVKIDATGHTVTIPPSRLQIEE